MSDSFWTITHNYFSTTWRKLISGRRAAAGLLILSRSQSSCGVRLVLDETRNYFLAIWSKLSSGPCAATAGMLMLSRSQSSYVILTVLDESLTGPPPASSWGFDVAPFNSCPPTSGGGSLFSCEDRDKSLARVGVSTIPDENSKLLLAKQLNPFLTCQVAQDLQFLATILVGVSPPSEPGPAIGHTLSINGSICRPRLPPGSCQPGCA